MMGEPRRPTTRPSRGRQMLLACAVSFCFCGFPLILGEVASSYLWEVRREALEREQFAALQTEVTGLLGLAEAEDLIQPALRRLVERAEAQSCPHRWVYPRLRALVRRYPGLFSFFLADDRDRVIWKSDQGESARLATRFLQRLREIERGERHRLDLKEAPSLALLLGGRPGQPKFENIGQGWTDINRLPRKTWLFTHLGSRFSLLAFVHRQGFAPDLGIRSRMAAPPRGEIALPLLDTYSMTLTGPGDEAFRRLAIPVILRGERENTSCLREGGRLWAMGLVDSR